MKIKKSFWVEEKDWADLMRIAKTYPPGKMTISKLLRTGIKTVIKGYALMRLKEGAK